MYQDCNRYDVLELRLSMWGGRTYSLGQYFQVWEMQCHDGSDIVLVHPALIVLLNDLRRYFEVSVNINSGYRTDEYNQEIGGAKNSYHKIGMAADVVVFNVLPEKVVEWAEHNDVGGIGRYNSFTHLDVGPRRDWDNR